MTAPAGATDTQQTTQRNTEKLSFTFTELGSAYVKAEMKISPLKQGKHLAHSGETVTDPPLLSYTQKLGLTKTHSFSS